MSKSCILNKILILYCSSLLLCSCLTQKTYLPYCVYQKQLNESSIDNESDIICMVSQKKNNFIFFPDFTFLYYKSNIVDEQTFLDLYYKHTGVPSDYSIEIWYNLFEIPCYKAFEWKANRFNNYNIDVLIR